MERRESESCMVVISVSPCSKATLEWVQSSLPWASVSVKASKQEMVSTMLWLRTVPDLIACPNKEKQDGGP